MEAIKITHVLVGICLQCRLQRQENSVGALHQWQASRLLPFEASTGGNLCCNPSQSCQTLGVSGGLPIHMSCLIRSVLLLLNEHIFLLWLWTCLTLQHLRTP